MIRRPPRSTLDRSSAASDVYKRQEIALVDGAIAVEGEGNVEIADLVSVGEARDLEDGAVVASLRLFRVLDDLVDEVAEVQDEPELIGGRGALVLEDHPAIG